MATPCEQFFGIQELVDILASFLTQLDLSRLTRTSRTVYTCCTPALYKELSIVVRNGKLNVFNSTTGMAALARNIQHVRKAFFGVKEQAYYYNCVLAFEELQFHQPTDMYPSQQRPNWLTPPDPLLHELVPLPPLTNLLDFSFTFDTANNPYKLPNSLDHRAMMAQLSWMISLNRRNLINLSIADIPKYGVREGEFRDLCGAISELTELKELDVSFETREVDIFQTGLDVFFSCRPSIRDLWICVFEGGEEEEEEAEEEEEEEDDGDDNTESDKEGQQEDQSRSRKDNHKDRDLVPLPRRQEPLSNLEMLELWDIGAQDSTSDVLSVFAHCPNIKELSISSLAGYREVDVIGQYIGKMCPRIKSLSYSSTEDSAANDSLPFRIMDALPAQQLREVQCYGLFAEAMTLTDNFPRLARHFDTLQQLVLHRTGAISRISISRVFRECNNLENLLIECRSRLGCFIELSDAIDGPWNCLKLKQLRLSISECVLPVEVGVKPYYSRPTPITLSADETRHFARLGSLYQRIGALTELRELDLRMVTRIRQSYRGTRPGSECVFHAMLSLGDAEAGRPGFLDQLAGLSKLEILDGSVRLNEEEAKVTIGWDEVRWMDMHWPRLVKARFFTHKKHITAPFRWLGDTRKDNQAESLYGYLQE
ncbi:hypothetical protein EC957_011484 [Mortierella hygrophila]|uniref:F-box domain-containing protein n=1 Tax=Mortierella hygrophila TaxID=979708 RepID=A0A9P6K456_9FUNG|nr:hypothetical protein EC957_011484 [Mortierella hygrophila]